MPALDPLLMDGILQARLPEPADGDLLFPMKGRDTGLGVPRFPERCGLKIKGKVRDCCKVL